MEKIPELYVEANHDEIIENGRTKEKCMIIQENLELMLEKGEKIPEFIAPEKSKFLKKEIYVLPSSQEQ